MDATLERTGEEYGKRAMTLLSWVRNALSASGIDASEPFEMQDMWRWSMAVRQEGLSDVDAYVEIPIAAEYGDGPKDGMAFGFGLVAWGGRSLGGVQPYNFTPDVWVRASDPDSVRARWDALEEAVRGYVESGLIIEALGGSPEAAV